MINVSRKSDQSNKIDSSGFSNMLRIGIFLSFLAISLLMVLIFKDIPIEVQQVIVVFAGLLLFASFSAFKKIINPPKKTTFLAQGGPYFDNRIITYNNYQGDSHYNPRQNLEDAAEEIQALLDKLSKTYDESPIDKSAINVELLAKIENTEVERHEKLTDKEKIIATQVIEEIEQNKSLKERVIKAMRAGGEEALKQLLKNYPAANIVLATSHGWVENDATESTEKTFNK